MLQLSMSKTTRERIAYMAMSVLIVWHIIAMVIESAPASALTDMLRRVFHPYMTLLGMDNNWGFFAPNVHVGTQFRYVVEDADGKRHPFTPADQLSRFHPASIWFKDRYKSIMDYPEVYGDEAALSLCRQHAPLRPVSVTLLRAEQTGFWPEDRLRGKELLDPEFIDVSTLKTVQCPVK